MFIGFTRLQADHAADRIGAGLCVRRHLKLDGKDIPFEPGDSIIKAASRQGIEIPHYCWHAGLSVAANAAMTLHIWQQSGLNSHHIAESAYKSFGRALRMAVEHDARQAGLVPSTKGTL